MSKNRREFMQSGIGLAGSAALSSASFARAAGANERITVGVIGCGGMGSNHLRLLAGNKDVQVAHVCDVDSQRLARAAKSATTHGNAPKSTSDLRRIVDDKNVDAVWVATPDHWHGPATLLALEAGKHVYVEKPCSHNIREGRLMIESAVKHRRIVQVGTQARSTSHVKAAIDLLKDGAIGVEQSKTRQHRSREAQQAAYSSRF